MRLPFACALMATTSVFANDTYPTARFQDPQRVAKLQSAMPNVDQVFRNFARDKRLPGLVWGVVIDGKLAHLGSTGVRERRTNTPIDKNTVFRIASMTKSFTALAILKLRDEGKLSLEDPVSKWIPELVRMALPTKDATPLRIRDLLSHNAGFPEDNPWGDQQLAATDEELSRWLRSGIPFSTPPGTRYEYSNYAFGLLGRVVAAASKIPYDRYVQQEILSKLQMNDSTFEYSSVPAEKRASGYRLQPDGTYLEEAPLSNGAFGAMGGLLTTAEDLSKYVAFQLSAWPPRDDLESGPVRRSSVREMNQMWRPANLKARSSGQSLQVTASGYGFGLRISSDCRFEHVSGHGGGLPGFGSYMLWLPDYGVGLFAMANLTYAGPAAPIDAALDVFARTGGLQKRELPASPMLNKAQEAIGKLWSKWDDSEAKQLAAMNLFLDVPIAQRREDIRNLRAEVGECKAPGPVMAENWLRGQFNMACQNGIVGVFFTMAPTNPPTVQSLTFQKIASDRVRLSASTGAPAGVSCSE